MENRQTALQFFLMGLVDLEIGMGIPTDKTIQLHNLFDQAKAMEKEQIKNAYVKGQSDCEIFTMESESEQYYIETYQ